MQIPNRKSLILFVSSAEVSPPTFPTTLYGISVPSTCRSPILPGAANSVILSLFRMWDRTSLVLARVTGFAPNASAFLYISPSVPLRPTLPPIPATGFTIKPIFLFISLSAFSSSPSSWRDLTFFFNPQYYSWAERIYEDCMSAGHDPWVYSGLYP